MPRRVAMFNPLVVQEGPAMRVLCKLGVITGVALLCVGLTSGQQPKGKGGFGGFGGFGRGQLDPAALLRLETVQKELKLSDEQIKKVDEAVLKALGEVLDPDQMKRLKQIHLQTRGTRAFSDPKVQEQLKFTAEQKDSIKTITEDSDKEIRELQKEGGGFENAKKIGAIRREADEKIRNVLTAEQQKTWREMTGEQFQIFPKGGFKKKGKDA
jgi:hypothetical protein